MANNERNKLTKKDTVVIWGGANDIAKHEAGRGLTHLSNFVELCTNTSVVVVGAPKRNDLSETSCVNVEVDKFNRQLRKMIDVFEYAKVVDSITLRECYTKHGLHLSSGGKEQMEVPPVITPASSVSQCAIAATRTSGRTRKQPTTRGDDFLWTGCLPSKV